MVDNQKPEPAKIVDNKDGTVTVVTAKNRRHHGMGVVLDSDDVLREQATGFANFLREYAVVGLAVGFIVGQQASTVVKQLVASFVDPWVKILFGQDLSTRAAHLHHHHALVLVPWGAFVYALIEFFLVLIFVYLLIKLFRLDKLRKRTRKKR